MKVKLVFVPAGGGEIDYSMSVEIPEIPRPGDYISIRSPNKLDTADFIVKRTWWDLGYNEGDSLGITEEISVECEFALSSSSSDKHKDICEGYRNRTGKLLKFDSSMY